MSQPSEQERDVCRRPAMGLRARMLVIFGLLFTLTLLLVSLLRSFGIPFTSFHGAYGDQKIRVFETLGLVADLKKEGLKFWIEERKTDVKVFAMVPDMAPLTDQIHDFVEEMRERGKTGDELWREVSRNWYHELLLQHLAVIVEVYPSQRKLSVADARTGEIIVSTDSGNLGDDVSGKKFFSDALRSGYGKAVAIERDPLSGNTSLIIARTITRHGKEDGKAVGLLIAHLDTNEFIKPMLYTGGGLGASGEVVLVDHDRRILVPLKHPLADETIAKALEYQITAQPATFAARGKEGILFSRDYRGVPVLAAYRHLRISPDTGWGMVVKVDMTEVFGPVWRGIWFSSLVGLAGIVVVIIVAILLAGRILQPVMTLSSTARKVEAGHLDARAPVSRSDEVGSLAVTFNSMVNRLKNWNKELEDQVHVRTNQLTDEIKQRKRMEEEINKLNEELERRVRDRTAQLEAANKELESFAYSVSHDLRAPLRSMDGFSKALLEAGRDKLDDQDKDCLQRIRAASQRMAQLIDDLLQLSRLTRKEMTRQRVDLSALANEIAAELQQVQPERQAEFVITPDLVADGDEHLLRVAMKNLLDNAWKFTGKHATARIEFGASRQNGGTVFFVRDDGAGFEMDYADKLFGAFQRLHSTGEFEGTGIGLATVQRIIHRHGGRVWAESAVEQGTTFHFTLP